MFGSHWDKAEATIVARLPKFTGDGSSVSYEFVADVRPQNGAPAFRATLQEPTIAIDFWAPGIGDVVSVLVKSSGKVKFDKDDPRISAKVFEAKRKATFEATRNQTFEQARNQEVGSPASSGLPANLAEVMAAQLAQFGLQSGQPGVQVFSVGDPEQTRAAADRLRAAGLGALADQVEAQGDATAGQGRPAHDAADADPATRLGTLENLRDRGLMTDEEYAAQRQRILDDI